MWKWLITSFKGCIVAGSIPVLTAKQNEMNSDITICPGDGCPVKEHCVRFLTPPDEHLQAYFFKPPGKRNEEGKWECEMFWGQPQERIMKQLKDILNGNEDDSN